MNNILKIIGIIIFFSVLGYAITYPYKIEYNGDVDIVLIDDVESFKTLENVINYPDLKNSVLYVLVWNPSEDRISIFSNKKEVLAIQNEKLTKIKEDENYQNYSKERIKKLQELIISNKYHVKQIVNIDNYIVSLEKLQKKYKNENFKVVFIEYPGNQSYKNGDLTEKWKFYIKKHKLKGYHFLASEQLIQNIKNIVNQRDESLLMPFRLLTDNFGIIRNYNTLSGVSNSEQLYQNIDSLLIK